MLYTPELPSRIFSGNIPNTSHVQGIATDGKYMYYSFTTILLKTDLEGNYIGSVTGLTGHLGCIAWSDAYGGVIGSLEYKNDAIGRGILSKLGREETNPDAFYIARFDVDKITEMNMDATASGVMTAVKLADVCEDYLYDDGSIKHRHGCSGIDGITVVPGFMGGCSILVAYGIYGDVNRDDNDNQVLLRFDSKRIADDFRPLTLDNDCTIAIRADDKLFVHTGNTTYGIQNLEYDSHTDCIIAAVYKGQKEKYPNYSMYFITPDTFEADGLTYMPLAERGELDLKSGIRGCNFPYGSTGIISLGGGYYYFSEDGKTPDKEHYTNVQLYRIKGDCDFVRI
ncbi:MAG: hypothetical protein HFE63_03675 [Clostridiales bacterium]|nr:hypothetical protein [Clostridiales bacterium]